MKLKELSKLPKITAPKSFVEKAGKDTPRMIKKYGLTEYDMKQGSMQNAEYMVT